MRNLILQALRKLVPSDELDPPIPTIDPYDIESWIAHTKIADFYIANFKKLSE